MPYPISGMQPLAAHDQSRPVTGSIFDGKPRLVAQCPSQPQLSSQTATCAAAHL